VVAAAAAVGAALASGAPTDVPVLDGAFRALLGAGFVVGAARARPIALVLPTALAVVASCRSPGLLVLALGAFACALGVNLVDRPGRASPPARAPAGLPGAVIGAATVQVLLRLPAWGPPGTSAAVGAAAVVAVALGAWGNSSPHVRRRLVLAAGIVGGVLAVLVAAFGVSVLLAKADAEAGAAAAREGVDAARAGRTNRAIRLFEDAERHLEHASDKLALPWSRAARVVPVVGQHERAVRQMVSTATELARTGALTARKADVQAIRAVDGRVDPALLAALEDPLHDVVRALGAADRDLRGLGSMWLAGSLRSDLRELRSSIDDASHDAATAILASRVAPRLLGAGAPKRYFLMFTTPTEARAGGGFMGNWGIVTAADGRLSLERFGRTDELNAALNDGLDGSGAPGRVALNGLDEYVARYGLYGVTSEWRNLNMSPDFATVAEAVRQVYPQSGGEPIDGVIAIDPKGLARLLRLTGPVDVASLPTPLTPDNAAQILLRDQYVVFPSTDDRTDFLADAAEAVTTRLTTSSLPGPRAVGETLGPAVRSGHLLFTAFDDGARRLLDRLGVTGRFGPHPGDALGLVTQNFGGNKIDLFLHRRLDVRTTIDPSTGRMHTRATIRLRNDAPSSGLPDYVIGNFRDLPTGTNRLLLSLYSPLVVEDATLDGEALRLVDERELDLNVYSTVIDIPPGSERVVRIDLEGGVPLLGRGNRARYRLDVWQQTMVNPDRISVVVEAAGGWRLQGPASGFRVDANEATYAGRLVEELSLRAVVTE
jgi:hypothetical protein